MIIFPSILLVHFVRKFCHVATRNRITWRHCWRSRESYYACPIWQILVRSRFDWRYRKRKIWCHPTDRTPQSLTWHTWRNDRQTGEPTSWRSFRVTKIWAGWASGFGVSSRIPDGMPKPSARPSVTWNCPQLFKPSASLGRKDFLTFVDIVKSSAKPELVVVSTVL
jgi:hypothetical protein